MNSVVCGPYGDISRLSSEGLVVEENKNCTHLNTNLNVSRSISNNHILTSFKNLHTHSDHIFTISGYRDSKIGLISTYNQLHIYDANENALVNRGPILSKATEEDKLNKNSFKYQAPIHSKIKQELPKKIELHPLGTQIPLNT